jgi:hypothetical protein
MADRGSRSVFERAVVVQRRDLKRMETPPLNAPVGTIPDQCSRDKLVLLVDARPGEPKDWLEVEIGRRVSPDEDECVQGVVADAPTVFS